ncbi:hypothetical protein JZK55_23300 [Dissulfurispira thermophila]|uniref:Biotin-protein ligase N-terminal domain-containing protein n=2 Tax=root TaxID=1 RepID=A0A7G1H3U6_9BACT|nr:BPL-N domain-containing protein [Dissulfurispira thermophila]BCB97408.1 hypothetical protein JZK55_23300 [Dissulfurispira thermophila]
MAYKALKANNLSFELITSEDIRKGCLKDYKMLFVPGGWASNKLKTLGNEGINEIRNFVNRGGNYLGFCGGAGLATLDGIGLLNIKRMPTGQRVPSFSGRIYLNINEHPVWNSLEPSAFSLQPIFHAWWPSQFLIKDKDIKILATYGDALPDSFSSDLNVGDVQANRGWSELEDAYKINLNPDRLKNEPAIVEGNFGKGKVILSLIHFDTPDDENGAAVLKNLWKYLGGTEMQESRKTEIKTSDPLSFQTSELVAYIENTVDDLISLGIRNFLWFWRNPMLLQWRRGVRGLEYCTLHIIVKEIAEMLKKQHTEYSIQDIDLDKIKELLIPFVEKAKQLLIMERIAMQNGYITYEKCNNPQIQNMRIELFGNSKSHGGLFKKLIDELDNNLYILLKKTGGHNDAN